MIAAAKLRLGLIGAGPAAHTFACALERGCRGKLVAVADRDLRAASAVASRLGAAVFPTAADMLGQVELDALILAAGPAERDDLTVESLHAGLPVFCEMPVARNRDSAARIAAAARSTGTTLCVAAPFRLADDVRFARELITLGLLGALHLCEVVFAPRGKLPCQASHLTSLCSSDVLAELGAPCIDLMRYFLGPLAEIQAFEGPRVFGLPAQESVRLFVRSSAGVAGEADLSLTIPKEAPYYASFYGSQGALLLGWNDSKYRIGANRWITFGHGYRKLATYQQVIDNFAAAVRLEGAPAATLDDALAAVEAITAASSALSSNIWRPIAPPAAAKSAVNPLINIG